MLQSFLKQFLIIKLLLISSPSTEWLIDPSILSVSEVTEGQQMEKNGNGEEERRWRCCRVFTNMRFYTRWGASPFHVWHPGASLLATPCALWLVSNTCVCVRWSAALACGSVWVVMTWFAQLTAHILNCTCHVINLWGERQGR